jgi:hypothetical protein
MTWGETTSYTTLDFTEKFDKKVAVSPPLRLICCAAPLISEAYV